MSQSVVFMHQKTNVNLGQEKHLLKKVKQLKRKMHQEKSITRNKKTEQKEMKS